MIDDVNKYFVKKWRRVLFTFLSLLIYYIISFLLHPDAHYWTIFLTQPFIAVVGDICLSLLFCIAISRFSIMLNNRLNKSLPWTEKTLKRVMTQTSLQLLGVITIIAFQVILGYFFYDDSCTEDPLCNFRELWNWLTGSVIIGLVISSINTGSYIIENWKKSVLEAADQRLKAADMKRAVTEAELHALKLQIDPHFVFNNLSVLSELILKDQQLGYEFSENFSKVYRYLLVNSRKDFIALSDELKFLKSYIFLLKNRIGNGVNFEIEIDKASLSLHLPPLTLQLLIENTLKHNQTNKNNPLTIKVYNKGTNALVVENRIVPIQGEVTSSGTGLKNIIGRYSLLTEEIPVIIDSNHTFKVIIPLIG